MIYTIGFSNQDLNQFVAKLQRYGPMTPLSTSWSTVPSRAKVLIGKSSASASRSRPTCRSTAGMGF